LHGIPTVKGGYRVYLHGQTDGQTANGASATWGTSGYHRIELGRTDGRSDEHQIGDSRITDGRERTARARTDGRTYRRESTERLDGSRRIIFVEILSD